MVIKLSSYEDGVHHLEFSNSVVELGLEEPFIGNVEVSCKMDKSHHQIYLSCDLSVDAELGCDRCAVQFSTNLKKHFESVYLFSKTEKESDEEGVYYISPETHKISIKDDVLEYSHLAIPLKVLCNEDCKGLCSKCGADLNIKKCDCTEDKTESVWEPLKKLKDKLN